MTCWLGVAVQVPGRSSVQGRQKIQAQIQVLFPYLAETLEKDGQPKPYPLARVAVASCPLVNVRAAVKITSDRHTGSKAPS